MNLVNLLQEKFWLITGIGIFLVLLAVSSDAPRFTWGEQAQWHTYSNSTFDFSLSYPSEMELNDEGDPTDDQYVFLSNQGTDVAYNIHAGAVADYKASSTDTLIASYKSVSIPQIIEYLSNQDRVAVETDFQITVTDHNGNPAIKVLSPLGVTIETFNESGDVFSITAHEFDGNIESSKGERTLEIMNSFQIG